MSTIKIVHPEERVLNAAVHWRLKMSKMGFTPADVSDEFLQGVKRLAEETGDEEGLRYAEYMLAEKALMVNEDRFQDAVHEMRPALDVLYRVTSSSPLTPVDPEKPFEMVDRLENLADEFSELLTPVILRLHDCAVAKSEIERIRKIWEKGDEGA